MSGRFKIIFLLAQFLLVVLLCACSDVQADAPGPSFEPIESFVGGLSNAVQSKDRDRVFRDPHVAHRQAAGIVRIAKNASMRAFAATSHHRRRRILRSARKLLPAAAGSVAALCTGP